MGNCLGLFVQNNLIKYAKISKENGNVKIENHGVKFYEQELGEAISQIVNETFSYKTPISINLSNEKYTNSEIFGLLNESDQRKVAKTEFDYFCSSTGKNKLTLEYRNIITDGFENNDKKNVLYCFSEKGSIAERIQLVESFAFDNLSPVSFAISDLVKNDSYNSVVVNIEDRTEVTTIINNTPVKVDVLDAGMEEILTKIAERENSISKAYEICKNTTLYTASSQNLQGENNEYLDIIVPTIYKIVQNVKEIIDKNNIDIEKIYITGTAVNINNIDLYFQENFLDYKCEILTPYFVDRTSLKLNIKDYIEVNSAIAMAMQVLDKKNKAVNFSSKSETWRKIQELLNTDIAALGKKNKDKPARQSKINISEMNSVRFLYGTAILFMSYIIITGVTHNQIKRRTQIAQDVIDDTKTKSATVQEYSKLIDARTENYRSILEQLEEAKERIAEQYRSRNAVPNFLSEIMFAIPKEAQILSIENTEEKHVIIQAQSAEYQYLGYLKSEIQNRAILTNVTSTSGTKINDMIQVTIEGDLPY